MDLERFSLMKNITNVTIILVSMILFIVIRFSSLLAQNTNNYEDLHALFFEWRKFENPPLLDGAPNYTKSQFRKRQKTFKLLETKYRKS